MHDITAEGAGEPSASVMIDKIQPAGGPAFGNTLLTIFGSGFAKLDAPLTADGPLDQELYETDEPRHDLQRSSVSRDGTFCLFEGISAEIPGGAQPFVPSLLRETVPATVVSAHEIRCDSPRKEAFDTAEVLEMVNVSITLNGNPDDRTISGHEFGYYREDEQAKPRLRFVSPRGGPIAGNTTVIITGHRIRDLSGSLAQPTCQFGDADHIVSATIVDPGDATGESIRCVSPPLLDYNESLDVRLSVAPNGQDYIRGRALRYMYYPLRRVRVDHVHPQGGPHHGGVTVRVSGTHLLNRGGVLCRFGAEIVHARPTGENSGWDALLCESPPLTLPANPEHRQGKNITVDVQVSVNNDTAAFGPTEASFTYYEDKVEAGIKDIYPDSGPSRGGTEVKIRANHRDGNQLQFPDLGGLFCQFGDSDPIPATFDVGPASGRTLNTSRRIADQPLGRPYSTNSTHEFWCEAPSAASVCTAFDTDGLCRVAVRITVNNQTWGPPVQGGFIFYPS